MNLKSIDEIYPLANSHQPRDAADLIGPPFTNINPQGIRGVFPQKQLEQVLSLIEQIGQYTP